MAARSNNSLRERAKRYKPELHALRAIVILFPLAWLMPVSRWPSTCKRINRILGARKSRYARQVASAIAEALEEPDHNRALDAANQILAGRLESYMHCFRHYRRSAPPPTPTVRGMQHVEKARTNGQPVILWSPPQLFASLSLKQAFHEKGLELHHVSVPVHGFLARTSFGRRHINPVITRIEDRFLAERITYTPRALVGASLRIDKVLRNGGILSVTAGAGPRSEVVVPLLEGRHGMRMAIGPIKLAWRYDAALLPCHLERASDGTFTACITQPLDVATSDDPSESAAAALQEYADRLSSVILAQPHLWPFGAEELG